MPAMPSTSTCCVRRPMNNLPRRWGWPRSAGGPTTSSISMAMAFMPRKNASPRRVQVPAMPMQERLQLAGAIVERRGKRLADLPELTPLLRFTRGNPLTILVTLGEALRAGIDTPARLDAFVAALHGGEVAFEDEASEGRSKSLGASLSYGFGTAFADDARKVLALLHLFQGFVDVDALRAMGNPEAERCLAAVRGLTRECGIALLDRAAEIGLLHPHDGRYYT